MQGIRFYLEHENSFDKRTGKHNGNVVAVIPELVNTSGSIEAVGAVDFHPNSQVAGTAVSREYLQKRCKRIAEAKAREIHPALFTYLDRSEGLKNKEDKPRTHKP